ncbi:MAG TPA: YciI family protein [Chloroflexota bacterium]
MRYLSFFKSVERDTPPTESEIATMTKFIEEAANAGWLLSTEGCLPSALGARVRRADGSVTVLDGPFTEAKEVIGGFAIMQANSKEEMIALAKRFLEVVGDGECEIRQLYEEPALDSAAAHEIVSGATRSA